MTGARILCVSFSPITRDSRVLRQLDVLREFGAVTTVGYGPAPTGVVRHIEVPEHARSLPQTAGGVARLALRRFTAVELESPGERAVREEVASLGRFDLIVANDARALPIAFLAARDGATPVWADLHEWAPQENSSSIAWRVLVGPYMTALCRRYLPKTAAVTTVSGAIADLYRTRFGVTADVVRNAIPDQHLAPSATLPDRIRLVHSGVAAPERNIEGLITAVDRLDERFTLDLFLVGEESGHLGTLRTIAARSPRVRIHPPVAPTELPSTLNKFDLGVYILPVKSLNHRLMLPNKVFDFVQARLGLVFGPSVETDRIIREHGIGVVTDGWHADDLVAALRELTVDDVAGFKNAAGRAASALSNESDIESQRRLVDRLLSTE